MARPTMMDVAEKAGVARSTVSRALGPETRHLLSQETVQRVEAAAEELGYRPNALARGLRTQRSATIGMLVPDLTNPFFPPIVRGLEDTLGGEGYTLIVVNTDNDETREKAALEKLLHQQVDGFVLATVHLQPDGLPDAIRNVPSVLVNRRSDVDRLSSVVPHDEAAVREVVQHLAELGHRSLAHVAGPQALSTGRDRRTAFERACAEAGVEAVVEVADGFTVRGGAEAAERLLARGTDATGVFAANDLLALGVLRVLRERGVRVPEEISLVGYNDMPLVEMLDPPLTTVKVPQYQMGREAARLLLEELGEDAGSLRGRSVQLPSHLVVRGSTAAPPA